MRDKPITPYARLLDRVNNYVHQVAYPRRFALWTYPKDKLGDHWNLNDLYHRVAAANTLGFDVKLTATDAGLEATYIKRPTNWDCL